jgi:hypothetical protein
MIERWLIFLDYTISNTKVRASFSPAIACFVCFLPYVIYINYYIKFQIKNKLYFVSPQFIKYPMKAYTLGIWFIARLLCSVQSLICQRVTKVFNLQNEFSTVEMYQVTILEQKLYQTNANMNCIIVVPHTLYFSILTFKVYCFGYIKKEEN